MKKLNKVKYVKHPISFEEKRKLNAEGFQVVDARFEPKSEKVEKPKAKTEKSS